MDFLCRLSAFCAALILNGLGIAVDNEGIIIAPLGAESGYGVIPECSGINSVKALVASSMLYAVFNIKNPLRFAFFVACSVPIALVTNILRLVLVVMVAQRFTTPAPDVFHFLSGFITFPIAIVIMLVIGRKLDKEPKVKK